MNPRVRRINEEILKCEMTLLGMELDNGKDWKTRLGRVRDLVNGMDGEWYFRALKGELIRILNEMIGLDIKIRSNWRDFHSLIEDCRTQFWLLKKMPNEILKETFEILYNGLNSKFVKRDVWMKIENKIQRDETIHDIMKSLGEAIQRIPDDNIIAIVGKDGSEKMKIIAHSLNGS